MLKKSVISVSISTGLISKIVRSSAGASRLVEKALNQFFHLEDENIESFSSEELREEYEKAKLRAASIDMELTERKNRNDAENEAKIAEIKREAEEQRIRIEKRRAELESRGGGGMRA